MPSGPEETIVRPVKLRQCSSTWSLGSSLYRTSPFWSDRPRTTWKFFKASSKFRQSRRWTLTLRFFFFFFCECVASVLGKIWEEFGRNVGLLVVWNIRDNTKLITLYFLRSFLRTSLIKELKDGLKRSDDKMSRTFEFLGIRYLEESSKKLESRKKDFPRYNRN